jgi:LytS/YehU family sensor histidine kinase
MYWIVPRYLIREKYLTFFFVLFCWICFGLALNFAFRAFVLIPFRQEWAARTAPYKSIDTQKFMFNYRNIFAFGSFFAMNAMLGFGCMIKMFQYWIRKQQALLQSEKEKVTAELQLLKAQVHPHFLFNTLNNIYSYSLEQSPKTPQLILKLSALLSYMLYDCKSDEVLLEKEIAVLKDYIDLEKERYGNRLDVSLNFEGDIRGKKIAPLIFLPFIENAFKHGTSGQLDKPWLSIDLSVKGSMLKCKIINSRAAAQENGQKAGGIGIANVRKRLELLYPGCHELEYNSEEDYFAVSLSLRPECINRDLVPAAETKVMNQTVTLQQ